MSGKRPRTLLPPTLQSRKADAAGQPIAESLLGRLLVRLGLISECQLEDALARQRRAKPHCPLGAVLIEMGLISDATLRGALTIQSRKGAGKPAVKRDDTTLRDRLASAPLSEFLKVARELDAADLHLGTGQPPMIRVRGDLRALPLPPLEAARCEELLLGALTASQREHLARDLSLDFALEDAVSGRFRFHLFRAAGALCGVGRAIADAPWKFSKLGLPQSVAALCNADQGLVLITGTVGAGKSTTLGALLNEINRTRRVHIVTIEDPVEVLHSSDKALVSQREVGAHTRDFASALRAALREDPDVIVVGELCDPQTTAIALAAAETGHLVLGTLHTGDAERSIHRILDQFPPHQRDHARTVLANVLRCVISQQLVPTADQRGQALAAEILRVTPAVANLIREDRVHQIRQSMQLGRRDGQVLMDDSLQALVTARTITLDQALLHCHEPERFAQPVGAK
ncbi:MAG: PilT/PilU family type 4a pilus ATPase [Planctomycetes bacterium]|nr:PilT/PilU family type 4a pilus ATPase [Planctomycetota bacterium]